MISRNSEEYLHYWYKKKHRKPLVIRGARQVGKSTLVREFAKKAGLPLVEINLERHPQMDAIFKRMQVEEILTEISLTTGKIFDFAKGVILFLDEIQATPSALPALRYLYEEKPSLHVIAAGSLLEFSLRNHTYSMPVGRIEYLYLGPITFSEYTTARGARLQLDYLNNYDFTKPFSDEVHSKMLSLLREYLLIGGMPEAISVFIETGNIIQALEIHHSIIDTYRNDFNKYATGMALQRLHRVFDYVPATTGEKLKYSNVNPNWQAREIRSAVDLLELSGVIFKVHCTSGAGIPLKANEDTKIFKPYFLDIGLMNAVSGIKSLTQNEILTAKFINEGKMAEQFIAQHLCYQNEKYIKPQLHYWLRDKKTTNAEVDFLIQKGQNIIPVEVKAGKSGRMKSLHLFCSKYKSQIAVRFDLNKPTKVKVNNKISDSKKIVESMYSLLSLPLYMVDEIKRTF